MPCYCHRDHCGLGRFDPSVPRNQRKYQFFCSARCADRWEQYQLIDKTKMEEAAIQAARMPLWETFVELGLGPTFQTAPVEVYDRIIEACVTGFTTYMQENEGPPF
jgi:hypothetical protein